MSRAARFAPLLVLLAGGAGEPLHAQARPRDLECSFLLFTGCRSYALEVVRIDPDGSARSQAPNDSYAVLDADTLDPRRYLVLETHEGDRLQGKRAVIWVERATGAVGGDWPSTLSNDAVRSAQLRGVPGDAVLLHGDRAVRRGGSARLVIFAGQDACRTEVNLNDRGGGCSTVEGRNVAGKVSSIRIEYRAPAPPPAAPSGPGAAPTPQAPAAGDTTDVRPALPAPPQGF